MPMSASERAAVKLYDTKTDFSVDQLPYTPEFEKLYKAYRAMGHLVKRADFWKLLTNLRKKGALKHKQRPVSDNQRRPRQKAMAMS